MTSQDAAAPPLASPKRPAPGEQPSLEVLVTYKRRTLPAAPPPTPERLVPPSSLWQQFRADGHHMLPRHWITWRDTLEGFLQSPGVNKGGGIQSCIQDALRYNCCQSVQKGDLNKGQGASEEHPAGVAGAKEISSSIALKDATAASLDANTAMCNNALLDIFVSEKFALLCDLLVGTFHVSKVHEVIDLGKIDTNMRNGNYTRNPALFMTTSSR
ncbi:hypothetical protein ZWY2020_010478 [Hordeum vulgare]|nr:hypothetical protein ZWY2020_010478 [Hordeum vulgare]